MLVPIESPCATSYWLIILTYILSRTASQLSRSVGQLVAFDEGVPVVNAFVLGNLCEHRYK